MLGILEFAVCVRMVLVRGYRRLTNKIDPASIRDEGSALRLWRTDRKTVLVRCNVLLKSVQRGSESCWSWMYSSSPESP